MLGWNKFKKRFCSWKSSNQISQPVEDFQVTHSQVFWVKTRLRPSRLTQSSRQKFSMLHLLHRLQPSEASDSNHSELLLSQDCAHGLLGAERTEDKLEMVWTNIDISNRSKKRWSESQNIIDIIIHHNTKMSKFVTFWCHQLICSLETNPWVSHFSQAEDAKPGCLRGSRRSVGHLTAWEVNLKKVCDVLK